MSRFQGTVTKVIKFAGVGLHSGKLVNLEISPAASDTGIVFQRSDHRTAPFVLAHPDSISATTLCTTIGKAPYQIATIEHLMAALYGLGIDNALVRVDAAEIPILDGSAAPFVDRLSEAGVQVQHVKRQTLCLDRMIQVGGSDQYVRYTPSKDDKGGLEIDCVIDFQNSRAIGKQRFQCHFSRETFMGLYDARTFCHINTVTEMHKRGLALGGSLDNAVVVDEERVLNVEGLRYHDEFVRHKLLDFIGDVSLLGCDLVGRIELYRAGHGLHAQFNKEVLREIALARTSALGLHTLAKAANQFS